MCVQTLRHIYTHLQTCTHEHMFPKLAPDKSVVSIRENEIHSFISEIINSKSEFTLQVSLAADTQVA